VMESGSSGERESGDGTEFSWQFEFGPCFVHLSEFLEDFV
jgi:hypothetical protein